MKKVFVINRAGIASIKKINCITTTVLLAASLLIQIAATAQKNYISIETGSFFGGPAGKIGTQMTACGFGDLVNADYNLFGADLFSTSTSYPITINSKTKYWLRYGRELTGNSSVEFSMGMIHNSRVSGFSEDPESTSPNIFYISGNSLTFENNIYAFSADYIFITKRHDAGIGAGPALALYKLSRFTPDASSTSSIQPGISTTAFWRFINHKVFFMALRCDAMFFVPHIIDAVSVTDENGYKSTFPSTKVNAFNGDLNVSIGFKF